MKISILVLDANQISLHITLAKANFVKFDQVYMKNIKSTGIKLILFEPIMKYIFVLYAWWYYKYCYFVWLVKFLRV
jgi:hypothetical protein